jgi:hypothetical protein
VGANAVLKKRQTTALAAGAPADGWTLNAVLDVQQVVHVGLAAGEMRRGS